MIRLGLFVPAARRSLARPARPRRHRTGGTSFVFLFVSERMSLFGFQEHGYRAASSSRLSPRRSPSQRSRQISPFVRAVPR